jgi:hypothetical protein
MLEKFVPRGTYADIAGVMRARYGALCSHITFPLPDDPAVVVSLIQSGPSEVYNFFMQAAARGIL